MKPVRLVIFLMTSTILIRPIYATASDSIIAQLDEASLKTTKNIGCEIEEELFAPLNLYSIKCSTEEKNALKSLTTLKQLKNSPITNRKSPNDPKYSELWSLSKQSNKSDISAEKAWNFGTGGKNALGEDIVVAIVDGGVDFSHPDLVENQWTNTGEVPGNGIDDDGNGYIDDIHGWNVFNNTGNVEPDTHGTHVAGIIGAKGNNGQGVAGVNWNVKIMGVSGSSGNTATVLKAYNYIIKQKLRYINTNGKEGANVVSTNSSFGVDYANCKSGDFKLWNDVYTELGKVGILNAAATANNEVNVDQEGDVPTGCESDAIISVTNTNNKNEKYQYAGYGVKSIDIGAPGTDIYSTVPTGSFQLMTGTSMATPHIAGAIAFLHSVASEKFLNFYRNNPLAATVKLKEIMLENVDKNKTLKGKTVSGGKLNLFKSAEAIKNY